MASGPTQNYDDATLGRWRPHPALARCVRFTLLALPPLVAVAFGSAAVRWASAERLGVDPWLWLGAEITIATALLLAASRVTRRLLPLSTLLRLTLYFPDRAPSRFAVALRRYSPDVLRERVEAARGRHEPLDEEHGHAAHLLDLIAAISAHDHNTRGHSERVQAYSALIGRELGLSARDAAQLSWAALLHDVGKLHVPPEILDKAGRPTDEEWQVIASHPSEGMAIARPLAAWLGPWIEVVGQHHERWDGNGYPRGLAGSSIHPGARIVAVADAFDAITSVRSYKKPLSASAARAELARCSGQQFDPEVVRAFLALGLGRLRMVAGPASALAALPGLRSLPQPDLTSLASGVMTAVSATTAIAVAGLIGGVFSAIAPASGADRVATVVGLAANDDSSVGSTPSDSDGTVDPTAGPVDPPTASPTPSPTASTTVSAPAPPSPPPPTEAAPATGPEPSSGSPAPAAAPTTAGPAPPAAPPPPPPPPPPAVTPPPAPPAVDPAASPCAQAVAGATSLPGADLSSCNLAGVTLTGDYSGANLTAANLSGATLTGLDLSGAKLNGAKLDGAVISATSFDDADMTGSSFAGATISGTSFLRAKLNAATLSGAQVTDCTFD